MTAPTRHRPEPSSGSVTRVARSWSTTLFGLVGGPLVAALGYGVAQASAWLGRLIYGPLGPTPFDPGSSIFTMAYYGAIGLGGIAGVVLCVGAIFGAGTAPCPSCGAQLDGLSTGTNEGVLCPSCHAYSDGEQGELRATPPGRVCVGRAFHAPLPEEAILPEGICCVCGSPSTRSVEVTLRLNAPGGSRYGRNYDARRLAIPHCASHDDGASLGGDALKQTISFRSYAYLRQYCEMNRCEPQA
jgi:hypothetical protein